MLDSHQWLNLIIGDFPGMMNPESLLAAIPIVAGAGLFLLVIALLVVWAAKSGITRLD